MNSKKWKQRAWLVAVAFILICVVNPELRALVFLIDVLSLEVFLLIAGLQLKGLWLVVRPAAGNLLASLTRSLGAAARHLGFATDALSPRAQSTSCKRASLLTLQPRKVQSDSAFADTDVNE